MARRETNDKAKPIDKPERALRGQPKRLGREQPRPYRICRRERATLRPYLICRDPRCRADDRVVIAGGPRHDVS